ncbi:MAG: sulfurtransferase TusA family protein [Armatimonadetes bacterium]|nr:sulfurtransferase TusA family protein [Armatimonadota bacterium]
MTMDEWDAGDMGCGDLLIELRRRLAALDSGRSFRLVTLDPGAIEDVPAWCRLTGHTLVRADPPTFIIEVR